MFNAKDTIGTMGSLNKEGDHSKIDECLKIMDQMQRKIDKYEKKAKDQAKNQNAYNDLLIKYNTIVYKLNTNTVDSSLIHGGNSQMDHQTQGTRDASRNSNLRTKAVALSQSEKRLHPNKDLMLKPQQTYSEQNQSRFVVRPKDGGQDCDASVAFVEDNCENQNPNYLRDPRLGMLEDENRFLKEELNREKAKCRFYRAKFRQLKATLEKSKPVANWASNHGPANMCAKLVRPSSAHNRTTRVEKYISPFLKREPSRVRKQPKSTRSSAHTQGRKISTSLIQGSKAGQTTFDETLKRNQGPLSQLAANLLGHGSASRKGGDKPAKSGKETAVSLHRKINKLDAVINRQNGMIKDLKHKVLEVNAGALPCCCEELKFLFEEKEAKLT